MAKISVYRWLSLAGRRVLPGWVKILGLWGMHVSRRRVLGVFVDPVLACNLQCRMCYFSDPSKRASMHGRMTDAQIEAMERAFYDRALKLQIGCGAEPSLDRRIPRIVSEAKKRGVPYVALTTNGQLYAAHPEWLRELVRAGLDEITLSMHGTTREVYEHMMPGAKYDNLLALVGLLADIKQTRPQFKIRVNYTVNSGNIGDLCENRFWALWDKVQPDIIQLRPVQKLGETSWTDFDLTPLREQYDSSFGEMIRESRRRGIICLAPDPNDISEVATPQGGVDALIEDLTYCYVSPEETYHADFNPESDTYDTYHRRHHTARRLFKAIFGHISSRGRIVSKKLNYRVKS